MEIWQIDTRYNFLFESICLGEKRNLNVHYNSRSFQNNIWKWPISFSISLRSVSLASCLLGNFLSDSFLSLKTSLRQQILIDIFMKNVTFFIVPCDISVPFHRDGFQSGEFGSKDDRFCFQDT